MNKASFARKVAPAVGAGVILVTSNRLDLHGPEMSVTELTVLATLALLLVLAIELSADFLVNRYWAEESVPRHLATLRMILNSCSRSSTERFIQTTIGEHLTHAEEVLAEGDIVLVLTHDLDVYDAIDPVVRVIADNLKEGVKYVYLVPDDGHVLGSQVPRFAEKIVAAIGPSSQPVRHRIESNLSFVQVRSPAIYHFAIVDRGSAGTSAYWYMTTPDSKSPTSSALVITELSRDNMLALYGSLTDMRSRGKALPTHLW